MIFGASINPIVDLFFDEMMLSKLSNAQKDVTSAGVSGAAAAQPYDQKGAKFSYQRQTRHGASSVSHNQLWWAAATLKLILELEQILTYLRYLGYNLFLCYIVDRFLVGNLLLHHSQTLG